MSAQPNVDPNEACVRCEIPLSYVGVFDFRTGGETGAALFFLGQWAELGEDKITLQLYNCPRCRMVELKR
jgi:hypothetical protein